MLPFARTVLTAALFLAAIAAPPARGQLDKVDVDKAEDVVRVEAEAVPPSAAAGAEVVIAVKAVIDPGWGVYSTDTTGGPVPTAVTVFPGKHYTVLDGTDEPKPRRKWDDGFGVEVGVHKGSPVFKRRVRIGPAAPEVLTIRGELFAQGCSDTTCLAPQAYPFAVTVTVAGGAVAEGAVAGGAVAGGAVAGGAVAGGAKVPDVPADGGGPVTPVPVTEPPGGQPAAPTGAPIPGAPIPGVPDSLLNARIIAVHPGMERDETAFLAFLRDGFVEEEERSTGMFWLLLFGFLSGLAALATPCVYPMIPITVSFFTKLGEQRGGRSLGPALVYCLGIVVSFTVLGLVLTLLLGASGTQDFGASPIVNAAVGLLFVVFALSLFGMFELKLPRFLTSLAGSSGSPAGYTSVLLMGLTFAVTSFACTGPFVGAILAGTSTQGFLGPTLGMVGFSSALALPFFFLALIPQVMAGLPKSGGWMLAVKVVMGFLVLLAAFKFFANADHVMAWGVLTRETVVGIWIAIGLAASLYLFGVYHFRHEEPVTSISVGRMAVAVLFLGFAVRMVPALFGAGLGELDAFLPQQDPRSALCFGGDSVGGRRVAWITDLAEAEREARATGKRLFLDFTGHTCSNCRWMEANMFRRSSVVGEMEKYVPVELYTDRRGDPAEERNRLFREIKFKTVANPLYAIVELP